MMDSSAITEERTVIDGHEYVDLGFPSGVLWATCNIGASCPEEFGDYFAWGETQPKDCYDVHSYKHCKEGMTNLTKYCTSAANGYWGFKDNICELLPEDDAATANWGGKWKMPTIGDCLNLFDSRFTTTKWTTHHGVYGRMVTSNSNGRSIFLPAAGYRFGATISGIGQHGSYWSSMLRLEARIMPLSYEARMFRISPASIDYDLDVWKNCYREYGLSIRPVCYRNGQ